MSRTVRRLASGSWTSQFLHIADDPAVPMATQLPPRPIDATLTVTKAARMLGVHPNTVRAWSDAGRLRYYRINPRGDRRYRIGDLQRFLAAAEMAPRLAASRSLPRGYEGPEGHRLRPRADRSCHRVPLGPGCLTRIRGGRAPSTRPGAPRLDRTRNVRRSDPR